MEIKRSHNSSIKCTQDEENFGEHYSIRLQVKLTSYKEVVHSFCNI